MLNLIAVVEDVALIGRERKVIRMVLKFLPARS